MRETKDKTAKVRPIRETLNGLEDEHEFEDSTEKATQRQRSLRGG